MIKVGNTYKIKFKGNKVIIKDEHGHKTKMLGDTIYVRSDKKYKYRQLNIEFTELPDNATCIVDVLGVERYLTVPGIAFGNARTQAGTIVNIPKETCPKNGEYKLAIGTTGMVFTDVLGNCFCVPMRKCMCFIDGRLHSFNRGVMQRKADKESMVTVNFCGDDVCIMTGMELKPVKVKRETVEQVCKILGINNPSIIERNSIKYVLEIVDCNAAESFLHRVASYIKIHTYNSASQDTLKAVLSILFGSTFATYYVNGTNKIDRICYVDCLHSLVPYDVNGKDLLVPVLELNVTNYTFAVHNYLRNQLGWKMTLVAEENLNECCDLDGCLELIANIEDRITSDNITW